ncbi:WD40-repeat-containing domain protein [Hyaloraphidium curvatum]|nr:WD40-repeat-containing domain protein [Hyaloraphidium curvatum]
MAAFRDEPPGEAGGPGSGAVSAAAGPAAAVQTPFAETMIGGATRPLPVVFTADSSFFFCASPPSVKLYSAATGQVVRTLRDETAVRITGLQLNPENPLQVFIAYFEGKVALWDFNDTMVVQSWDLDHNIVHFRLDPARPREALLVVRKRTPGAEGKAAQTSVLYRLDLDTNRLVRVAKARRYEAMAISPSGRFVAVCSGKKLVVTGNHDDGTNARTFKHDENIVAVDFHPTASCVAYGDTKGRISLLYFMTGSDGKTPLVTTLHWHAHRVGALRFTTDGDQLLSGGEEAVLIVWQLQTRQKSFLPRIGGEIRSIDISPDGETYAVGLADGSVKLLDSASLAIRQTVEGMRFGGRRGSARKAVLTCEIFPAANLPMALRRSPAGLSYEAYRNQLAFFGPRFVQFWSLDTNSHAADVEVTPRNRISRTETKELVDSRVTHVAFAPGGGWMATVDVRDDREFPADQYLKFWEWDAAAQGWTLNTRIEAPHGTGVVSGLAFNPAAEPGVVVSTGADRRFRVWTLRDGQTDTDARTSFWASSAGGDYKGKLCRGVSFSPDGSLFCVLHDVQTTIWDSAALSLRTVFLHPTPTAELHGATFLGRGSRHLVGWTANRIFLWDLLTCTVSQVLFVSAAALVADSRSPRFAVLTAETGEDGAKREAWVRVFEPGSVDPVLVHCSPRAPKAMVFARAAGGHSVHLVVLDRDGSVMSLREGEAARTAGDRAAEEPVRPTGRRNLLSSVVGRVVGAGDEMAGPATGTMIGSRKTAGDDFLGMASHLLPPLSSILDGFITGLVATRIQGQRREAAEREAVEEEGKQATRKRPQLTPRDVVAGSSDGMVVEAEDFSFLTELFRKK